MKINDRIYGEIDIDDQLIIDLIQSRPMQRLKHISQDGSVHFIQPQRNVTRYEHSIGTWYLSHTYNRPIEEQVASLLHDIPHTAFSHVIDFVVDDPLQEYHDKFTKTIILQSEIPSICKKHGLKIEKVLQKENFPLLDNKLPEVSVDRWDYFMRDGYTFGLIPKEIIQLFLSSIKEKGERFYFDDLRIASVFAILFLNCSRLMWLDPTSHGSFFLLAEAMKHAVKKHILTEDDFFQTDDVLMQKMRDAKDKKIDAFLNRLKKGKDFYYASKSEAEFYGVNKPRFVDPWVWIDGTLQHLSSLIPGMNDYLNEFKKRYTYIGVKQRI